MRLDSFTVLVFTCASLVFLGCALLYFWNRDRRSMWLLWWSAPFLVGGAAALGYVRPNWDTDFWSIGIGNALRIGAIGMLWQGARVFEGRRPLVGAVTLAAATWFLLSLIPPFIASMPLRIIGVSLANGGFCALAAWELWRGRAERLGSRGPAVIVFLSFAALMLLRIAGVNVFPFPMGALPLEDLWMGAFNLAIFGHAFALGLLLIALTKERLELAQRNIALVDPLTGLMNRRAFNELVEHNGTRQGQGDESTALLALDLDHFKLINDRYGHEVGDRVLAGFASVAVAAVRPTDMLYRLGGEEFCVVLPQTDATVALKVAERIRKAFAAQPFDVGREESLAATVSVGVAVAEHAGFDLETLLAAADAAVYEAKSRGRNRVILADPGLLGRSAAGTIMETVSFRLTGS